MHHLHNRHHFLYIHILYNTHIHYIIYVYIYIDHLFIEVSLIFHFILVSNIQ